MATDKPPSKTQTQEFLDSNQYSSEHIKQYEMVFGKHFMSPGGLDTATKFCKLLDLKKGDNVLDVGCGIGGSVFHMAQTYNANVHGIDLSRNMINLARQSASQMVFPKGVSVSFEIGDATAREFPENSFDLIYSRGVILHIQNKLDLFKVNHSSNHVLMYFNYILVPQNPIVQL